MCARALVLLGLVLGVAACRTDHELELIEEYTRSLMELPPEMREDFVVEERPTLQTLQTYHLDTLELSGQWGIALHADGRIEKDGVEQRWYENGQLESRRIYRAGPPVGTWSEYHENGNQRSEIIFDPDGGQTLARWWHPNGRRSAQGPMRDGGREGRWTYWHQGGQQVEEQGDYQLGLRVGLWRAWWPDGTPRFEGEYQASRRVGEWRLWDRQGGLRVRRGIDLE